MKVHRIITTIEVENDNSITSVELIKLSLDNIKHPLVITNITTNGSANDINQVYRVIDDYRLVIRDKLKSIVNSINDGFDDYECGIFGRDQNDSECNDDKTSCISELTTTHLVLQDDVGMTILIDIDTDITNDDLLL